MCNNLQWNMDGLGHPSYLKLLGTITAIRRMLTMQFIIHIHTSFNVFTRTLYNTSVGGIILATLVEGLLIIFYEYSKYKVPGFQVSEKVFFCVVNFLSSLKTTDDKLHTSNGGQI